MKHWKTVLTAGLLAVLPVLGFAADPSADNSILLQVEVPSATGLDVVTTTFSLADLQAMPVVSFETKTIWTEGVQRFTGVSLAELNRHLGIKSGTLVMQAVNDYVVEFPVSGAVDGGPIVAYQRNGAAMSRREKGPLWVVFPYDSDPIYRTEEVFSKSVWQLVRIIVKSEN